ncbi:putative Seipin [Hypsibius exemplaris]|uniref:Seipin n=1 Tax=Hypsibius exemplaris TaxID=2072580 RepID=A0A9X6NHY2_HYPEX|nr:putative Seipin [Hypsibius exemplaris]
MKSQPLPSSYTPSSMRHIDLSRLRTYNYIIRVQDRMIGVKNNALNVVFTLLFRILFMLTLGAFIFCLSLFAVFIIQYQLLPVMLHTFPVHLVHSDCRKEGVECGYPTARLPFLQGKTGKEGPLLMAGQKYSAWVEMELPECERNTETGTFMVKIDFHTWDDEADAASNRPKISSKIIFSAARAAMLQYRSHIHHTLRLVLLFPLYLTGYLEERQKLKVDLIPQYQESPFAPVTEVVLTIQKAPLDVYRMTLFVEAHLEGARYYMQKYPFVIGSLLAGLNFVCGVVLAGFSMYNRFARLETEKRKALLPTAPGKTDFDDDESDGLEVPGGFDPLETVLGDGEEEFDGLPKSALLRHRTTDDGRPLTCSIEASDDGQPLTCFIETSNDGQPLTCSIEASDDGQPLTCLTETSDDGQPLTCLNLTQFREGMSF